jgi:sugar phosphate isomerase/epimerase
MQIMISLEGSEVLPAHLKEIMKFKAGIELGSYGFKGVLSKKAWKKKLHQHKAIISQFRGPVVLHGPFLGIEYAYTDHLLQRVVNKRLDMIFKAAVKFHACRVVLHSGFSLEIELFKLVDEWLEKNSAFWKDEIVRWEKAKIDIALENTVEKSPETLRHLIDEVNNPFLGICLDVGHQHLSSPTPPGEWINALGNRIHHLHIHDNDKTADRHWPMGKGTIDFDQLFSFLREYTPGATLSVEVVDEIDVKLKDLQKLAEDEQLQ